MLQSSRSWPWRAPWLASSTRCLIDPLNRDVLPGTSGTVPVLAGEPVTHIFWMGTDSYGRDIYSRVLYGGASRSSWVRRWRC